MPFQRLVLLTGLLSITIALAAAPAIVASKPARAQVQLLASSPGEVAFEFSADSFARTATATGTAISAPGMDNPVAPGEPDVPGEFVLVGVPQEGSVSLAVEADNTEELAGTRLRAAPGFAPTSSAAAAALGHPGYWPAAAAELVDIERIRDLRVARVRLNPAQYDAARGTVLLHHRLRLALRFGAAPRTVGRRDPLDGVLGNMLLNGAEAVAWKLDPVPSADSIDFFSRSAYWCKVKTETTGVYRVTPGDLRAAGFDPNTIDPATLKLYAVGPVDVNGPYPDTMMELPLYVRDVDGRFDGDDYAAFYMAAPARWSEDDTIWHTNPFTDYSVSWLTWGGNAGRRMDSVDAGGASGPLTDATNRVRLEPEVLCPARSGLLWLWQDFFKPQGTETLPGAVELTLPGRDTIREIRGQLYGFTSESYTVTYYARVYLNDALLDTFVISGRSQDPPAFDFRFDSLPLPDAARGARPDSFRLVLYGDQETNVYLDWLDVRYDEKLALGGSVPHLEFRLPGPGTESFAIEGATGDVLLLDISDPWHPRRLVNTGIEGSRRTARVATTAEARYTCDLASRLRTPVSFEKRTPGALRNNHSAADYLIVCPDEFLAAARLYAQYRQGNVAGIADAQAWAAPLSEIYDEYGFGTEEPGAIKKFLAAKQPAYVLFAGDGTYDYRNILGLRAAPGVPPYEEGYDLDPEVYGQTAKAYDAWYVDYTGDGLNPDAILGRVTVRSQVELRRFLDKVKRYETQPGGFWMKRFLLLSDDEYLGSPDKPDGIGFDHVQANEEMAGIAAGVLDPIKVYLTEYPLTRVNLKAEASAEFIRQLDAGGLLWSFYGHGAGFQLCHEQILHITNTLPTVHNGTRIPAAFFGSCGVGRFDDTRYEAIAEELVRKEDGCIATIGATKATSPGGNRNIGRAFFTHVLTLPGDPVGAAFFEAYSTTGNTIYHLFADPATLLRVPATADSAPAAQPDTFCRGGLVAVRERLAAGRGSYELSAHELEWFRTYHSDVGTTTYILPGYEISHAPGSFDSSTIATAFRVPRIDYPDTVTVPNGTYVRMANTCRLSTLAWDSTTAYTGYAGGIVLSPDTLGSADHQPPQVSLFADDIRLDPAETTAVPESFTLTGVLSDPSGILLVPVADEGLSLTVGTGSRTDLTGYFRYDNNSTTTGRFQYAIDMANDTDVITVVASDNLVTPRNEHRTVYQAAVRTRLDDQLRLDSCLVYPNPTTGPARFTFTLTRSALVSVKIYTIAGRLVRYLTAVPCGFDYNQIEWDGRDRDGVQLANGVYLYKLDARVTETMSGASQSSGASYRGKFIVHR